MQVKLGDLDLGRYFSTSKAQTNSRCVHISDCCFDTSMLILTTVLSSVGTPFYMSPECMRSEPCGTASFTAGFAF